MGLVQVLMGCRAAIGLGSNLGTGERNILAAVDALEHAPGIEPIALSSGYRTASIGPRQADFRNAALIAETVLEPLELLATLLGIEAGLGRRRFERFGPRIIDLDLLVMGDVIINHPRLTLPHPRLCDRAFALIPLLEVWPEVTDPRTGEPLRRSLERLSGQVVSKPRPLPSRPRSRVAAHGQGWAVTVRARSLEDLMNRAALALIDLMFDRRQVIERARHSVEVRGRTPTERMVGLLAGLISLVEDRGFAPRRVGGLVLGHDLARMAVHGEPLPTQGRPSQRVEAVLLDSTEVLRQPSGGWFSSFLLLPR